MISTPDAATWLNARESRFSVLRCVSLSLCETGEFVPLFGAGRQEVKQCAQSVSAASEAREARFGFPAQALNLDATSFQAVDARVGQLA